MRNKQTPGGAGSVGGATANSGRAGGPASGGGSGGAKGGSKPKPAAGAAKAGTASPSGGRARPSRAGLPKGAPYGATPGNAGANRPKRPTAAQQAKMDKLNAAYRAANPRTSGTGSRPSGRIATFGETKGKYVAGGAMAGLAGAAAGGIIASRNKPKQFKNGDKAVRGGKQVTYNNGSWYSN